MLVAIVVALGTRADTLNVSIGCQNPRPRIYIRRWYLPAAVIQQYPSLLA